MPEKATFAGIPIYSLLIVVGILVGIYIAKGEEKRLELPKDTIIDFCLWAIPLGIVGARLYYVAFHLEYFVAHPVEILQTWHGGLAIYGAVIGGLIGGLILSRRKRLPFSKLLDMAIPSLILAQAIGRWGNFFNQEAYGYAVTNPSLQFFPFAVQTGEGWFLATFFYESMWDLLVFILLYRFRKRMHASGDMGFWYFLLYGAGRMAIEGLRTDSLGFAANVRVSQLLSIVLCAGVFVFFALRAYRAQPAAFKKSFIAALIACACWIAAALYLSLAAPSGWFFYMLPLAFALPVMAYFVYHHTPVLSNKEEKKHAQSS